MITWFITWPLQLSHHSSYCTHTGVYWPVYTVLVRVQVALLYSTVLVRTYRYTVLVRTESMYCTGTVLPGVPAVRTVLSTRTGRSLYRRYSYSYVPVQYSLGDWRPPNGKASIRCHSYPVYSYRTRTEYCTQYILSTNILVLPVQNTSLRFMLITRTRLVHDSIFARLMRISDLNQSD